MLTELPCDLISSHLGSKAKSSQMGHKSLWDSPPSPHTSLSTVLLKTLFLKNTKYILTSGTSGLHYPCLELSLRYSHRSISPFS